MLYFPESSSLNGLYVSLGDRINDNIKVRTPVYSQKNITEPKCRPMSELRKDPVVDRWVFLAPERKNRPNDYSTEEPSTDTKNCPFCPGNELKTPPEIPVYLQDKSSPTGEEWTLRIVPNKYAALSPGKCIKPEEDSIYQSMNAVGSHEVIIESPDHIASLEDLTAIQIKNCFSAFRQRIKSLKQDPSVKYVLIFKNHGKSAGSTLSHSHCQLVALPMIPELVRKEIIGAEKYLNKTGKCVYCDLIKEEKRLGQRVVAENDSFIAFCPYASRFPYETWLLPKVHNSVFEQEDDYSPLAEIYKTTMIRIQKVLKKPAYDFILHTDPRPKDNSFHYHWYLEILPKTIQMAGFELGSGYYINPLGPEDAANNLRQIS